MVRLEDFTGSYCIQRRYFNPSTDLTWAFQVRILQSYLLFVWALSYPFSSPSNEQRAPDHPVGVPRLDRPRQDTQVWEGPDETPPQTVPPSLRSSERTIGARRKPPGFLETEAFPSKARDERAGTGIPRHSMICRPSQTPSQPPQRIGIYIYIWHIICGIHGVSGILTEKVTKL